MKELLVLIVALLTLTIMVIGTVVFVASIIVGIVLWCEKLVALIKRNRSK